MPSISVAVDISDFSDEDIREEYEYRFGDGALDDEEIEYLKRYEEMEAQNETKQYLKDWIKTYINMGNYKEALFLAEKLIPELRGISEKIN